MKELAWFVTWFVFALPVMLLAALLRGKSRGSFLDAILGFTASLPLGLGPLRQALMLHVTDLPWSLKDDNFHSRALAAYHKYY